MSNPLNDSAQLNDEQVKQNCRNFQYSFNNVETYSLIHFGCHSLLSYIVVCS